MPPQRSAPTQQQIPFEPASPNPLNPRGTPRRNRTTIRDYARPERIDEIIENPALTPHHTHPPSRPTIEGDDNDVNMADAEEDGEEQEIEEEVMIDQLGTPTRRNIPSTVVVKTRRRIRKPRKPRKETTWTQHYFEVTTLEETWINNALKSKPTLLNRL